MQRAPLLWVSSCIARSSAPPRREAFFRSCRTGFVKSFHVPTHTYPDLPCFWIFDSQYASKYSFSGWPRCNGICIRNAPAVSQIQMARPDGIGRHGGIAARSKNVGWGFRGQLSRSIFRLFCRNAGAYGPAR